MNKTAGILIAVVLIAGLAWFLSSDRTNNSALVSDGNSTSQSARSNAIVNNQTEGTPRNSVLLRETTGGDNVVIQSAELMQPGYVVIYRATMDGKTEMIGHSGLLGVGEHNNISIALSKDIAPGDTVTAVLHKDDGDGTFEVPGADLFLGNGNARFVSDVDVVDEPFSTEPGALRSQVETYLDATLDATTTAE